MVRGPYGLHTEILRGLSKSTVCVCDLSALQKATEQEYILLIRFNTGEKKRVLIRCQKYRGYIPGEFLNGEYFWYAHSHPGDDEKDSPQDRIALKEIGKVNGQEKSVIITESGKCNSFTAVEDMSTWTPGRR